MLTTSLKTIVSEGKALCNRSRCLGQWYSWQDPCVNLGSRKHLLDSTKRTHPLVGSVLSSVSSGILFAVFWPWHCLGSLNPSENVKTFRRPLRYVPSAAAETPCRTRRNEETRTMSIARQCRRNAAGSAYLDWGCGFSARVCWSCAAKLYMCNNK